MMPKVVKNSIMLRIVKEFTIVDPPFPSWSSDPDPDSIGNMT